jgi:hypothetical protein
MVVRMEVERKWARTENGAGEMKARKSSRKSRQKVSWSWSVTSIERESNGGHRTGLKVGAATSGKKAGKKRGDGGGSVAVSV